MWILKSSQSQTKYLVDLNCVLLLTHYSTRCTHDFCVFNKDDDNDDNDDNIKGIEDQLLNISAKSRTFVGFITKSIVYDWYSYVYNSLDMTGFGRP